MPIYEIQPQLVERCQTGDHAAFEQLYDSMKDDLFRWIFSLLRDHDEAEEAFQECIIRIFRHIRTLNDTTRFPHWVYRLVVNQCNTQRSRTKRHRYTPLEETIEVKPEDYVFRSSAPENPRRALMRKELRECINRHIADLPAKQRLAVLLFDVEGLSIREVAEELECSEGAVKFNIHEGRKKLKAALGPIVSSLRKAIEE